MFCAPVGPVTVDAKQGSPLGGSPGFFAMGAVWQGPSRETTAPSARRGGAIAVASRLRHSTMPGGRTYKAKARV